MAAAAAAAALERLEGLSCPVLAPLVPLAPAEALRLLCTPSAQRLALLEWLYVRVYPPLASRLPTLRDGPQDARLQELAVLGAQLLLCRPDDIALLQGTAPPEQQLEFIRDLLGAAPPPHEGGSPRSSRRFLSRKFAFLSRVLETPEGEGTLQPGCPPPPTTGPAPPGTRTPPARGARPELRLGALRRRLDQLEAEEAALGGSGVPAPPPLPALGVGGPTLAALAAAFGATELGGLGGGVGGARPPSPSRCGPLAPPVCRGLRALLQNLGVVTQLQDTAAEVTRLEGGRQLMETPVAALWQHFRPDPDPDPDPERTPQD